MRRRRRGRGWWMPRNCCDRGLGASLLFVIGLNDWGGWVVRWLIGLGTAFIALLAVTNHLCPGPW
jgi:hypothetical protein